MSFIQILETRIADIDELTALYEQWERKTEGRRTIQRSLVTRDRNDHDRLTIVAFFDSYEAAMQNSDLPETAALAEKVAALTRGRMVFHDLDVLHDRS